MVGDRAPRRPTRTPRPRRPGSRHRGWKLEWRCEAAIQVRTAMPARQKPKGPIGGALRVRFGRPRTTDLKSTGSLTRPAASETPAPPGTAGALPANPKPHSGLCCGRSRTQQKQFRRLSLPNGWTLSCGRPCTPECRPADAAASTTGPAAAAVRPRTPPKAGGRQLQRLVRPHAALAMRCPTPM